MWRYDPMMLLGSNRDRICGKIIIITSLLLFFPRFGFGWQPGTPIVSLEDKVDYYSQAIEVADGDGKEIFRLGPELLPIIDRKLREFISQPTSPQALRAHASAEMRVQDRLKWDAVENLMEMEAVAVANPKVTDEARSEADDLVYAALRSPYRAIPSAELVDWIRNTPNRKEADHISLFLDDPDEGVRVAAAQQLAKIGDSQTADKMDEVLKRRAKGLTPEQITGDRSFKSGYAAVQSLRLKGLPSASASPAEKARADQQQ
jgi:hypothetical protein